MITKRLVRAIIYTDGACSRNGQSEARAGIGVFWSNDSRCNISERIQGRQTNQRAEILATVRGIRQATKLGYSSVLVNLDSAYVRNAAERWIPNWDRNNWSGNMVNREEFLQLRDSMEYIDVEFNQVPSCDNLADPLARQGAAKDYDALFIPLFNI